MELKNVNPNGDNVVASNLINVKKKNSEIVKIEFKKKYHMLFFLKDVMVVHKTKFLILFTLQINIGWIKASPYIYGSTVAWRQGWLKNNSKNKNRNFEEIIFSKVFFAW
jgi:hypothetical protein